MMARILTILIGCVTLPGFMCQDSTIVELAQATDDLSTLVTALTAADLVETLGDASGYYTVFAPTNAAFAAIQDTVDDLLKPENKADLVKILTYHVAIGKFMAAQLSAPLTDACPGSDGAELCSLLQGGYLSVAVDDDDVWIGGEATVVTADVEASNGVVHIIDAVLIPPKNIVELAVATSDLSTLVAAVTSADLVDTLSGPGPWTVFAPTNAAFAAIQNTVDELLKPENKENLKKVLLYHVVPGRRGDISPAPPGLPALPDLELVTASGDKLSVARPDNIITIGGVARVITSHLDGWNTHLKAFNGVVHIIDAVLVPPPSTSMTSTMSDNETSAAHAVSIIVAIATAMMCV